MNNTLGEAVNSVTVAIARAAPENRWIAAARAGEPLNGIERRAIETLAQGDQVAEDRMTEGLKMALEIRGIAERIPAPDNEPWNRGRQRLGRRVLDDIDARTAGADAIERAQTAIRVQRGGAANPQDFDTAVKALEEVREALSRVPASVIAEAAE